MVEFTNLAKRFVNLANKMKDEGKDVKIINAALMSASCTYATYATSGNEGYLKEGGIDKVTALYRNNLVNIQQLKKQQLNPEGKD
ncbi:MAG: DUF3144 domain-containing protein [Sedimenticola sp.]|nr:MAG: DUF3144 domain-containing protein [Sedimenticola sp.]